MSNSLEKIDDNNFVIKYNGAYNKSSAAYEHIGCKWTIRNHYTGYSNDPVIFYLKCNANMLINNTNSWNITANLTTALINKDNIKIVTDIPNVRFDFKTPEYAIAQINTLAECPWYLIDNKLSIECHVKILSITGLPKRIATNLFEYDEKTKDVALIVEGKKLYVSKVILANFSPVFHMMFFTSFKESTDKEVVIKDVGFEEFEQFLQVIYSAYPDINKNNIKSILKLADRYDVQIVMEKCEKYLILTDDIDIGLKLGLAEAYTLVKLYETSMNSITTSSQVKAILQKSDDIGILAMKYLSLKATSYFN